MDSILLNSLFESVKKEEELYAHANLRSQMPDTTGLQELQQQWGAAYQDVKDKEAALGIQ